MATEKTKCFEHKPDQNVIFSSPKPYALAFRLSSVIAFLMRKHI